MIVTLPPLPLALQDSDAHLDDVVECAEVYVLQVMQSTLINIHQAQRLLTCFEAAMRRTHPAAADQIRVELSCVIQHAAVHERDVTVNYPSLGQLVLDAQQAGLLRNPDEQASFIWWLAASTWRGVEAVRAGSFDREAAGNAVRPLFAAALMALACLPDPFLAVDRQWGSEAIPY
ncbi:hypothetical protein [Pedococcus soli]